MKTRRMIGAFAGKALFETACREERFLWILFPLILFPSCIRCVTNYAIHSIIKEDADVKKKNPLFGLSGKNNQFQDIDSKKQGGKE